MKVLRSRRWRNQNNRNNKSNSDGGSITFYPEGMLPGVQPVAISGNTESMQMQLLPEFLLSMVPSEIRDRGLKSRMAKPQSKY